MVNAQLRPRRRTPGLLINGSQQVLYDPAGTFTHPDLPRRGDIHYGMTPRFVDYYERYHARFDYFVEAQKVPVSRAAADQLIANAQAQGQAMKMTCALDVADVLQPVPPFQDVPQELLPRGAARGLRADRRASRSSYVYEIDIGKNRAWERSDDPAVLSRPAPRSAPGSRRMHDRGAALAIAAPDAREAGAAAGGSRRSCSALARRGRRASASRSATWSTPSTPAPTGR